MKRIYFDYAATTPVDPEVVKAMEPYFGERFGNPSSVHTIGREAHKALEDARETLARFIGATPSEIIFNSGATEANNHAILGMARRLKNNGGHIIVSPLEHHCVLGPIHYLEREGFKVTYLKVDSHGVVDPQEVRKSILPQTILIAVMHASNEIGTIQPIPEIGEIAREHKISFLVDAAQTLGHIPVDVNVLGADLLSLSAHKFFGPKGIGALYVRQGMKIDPFLSGGEQERGQRASTQNVAGAVGLAKAVELCRERMPIEMERQKNFRDQLFEEIPKAIEGVRINGHPIQRLPKNAHFSFEKIFGEALLMSLDMAGICASMGAACHSGAMEPSHVLRAIGVEDQLALGSLRISVGPWTIQEEVDFLLEQLPLIVRRLRC